jgi:hypothetical protein
MKCHVLLYLTLQLERNMFIEKLKNLKCHVLFIPYTTQVYGVQYSSNYVYQNAYSIMWMASR